MTKSSKLVTPVVAFYRISVKGSIRYYPETTWKTIKHKFNIADAVRIIGSGIYDTAVSSEYAVELHSTKDDAEKSIAKVSPEKIEETLVEDSGKSSEDIETLSEPKSAPKPKKKQRTFRRSSK